MVDLIAGTINFVLSIVLYVLYKREQRAHNAIVERYNDLAQRFNDLLDESGLEGKPRKQ